MHKEPCCSGLAPEKEFDLYSLLEDLRDAINCSEWRTLKRFASAHNIPPATFSRKMNGATQFSIAEIACFFKELGLELELSRYML